MTRWCIIVAFMAVFSGQAVMADELVRFVSCPIYRDTDVGRKSGCWLADDPATGLRYDVGMSPIKPDWNYAVLVEGFVDTSAPDACGGLVLNAARVARLQERCTPHMLPAENYPSRVFSLPGRNVRPFSEARDVPPPPYEERTFPIFFELNRSFVLYQYGDYLLDRAVTWLQAANPDKIVITGSAVTDADIISGKEIVESEAVAIARAMVLKKALIRMGLPADRIETAINLKPESLDIAEADGLLDASKRRADIRAIFKQD